MRIDFYATLRQAIGTKTINLDLPDGVKFRQVVDEVLRLYPQLQSELFDQRGEFRNHLHILINGRDLRHYADAPDIALHPGDVVSIFPPVVGGG